MTMSTDGKIEALKATALFANCTRVQLDAIANVTEFVDISDGHVIVKEGHVGHDMLILSAGKAEVRVGDRLVATVGAGDVVGELGVVDGQRASATVTAVSDVEGFLIPRRGFSPLLDEHPALARPLLDAVIAKLRATDAELH